MVLTDTKFSFDVLYAVGKVYLRPLLCCFVGHKCYRKLRKMGTFLSWCFETLNFIFMCTLWYNTCISPFSARAMYLY